ncbi:hypothetical protein [Caballeronia mineralivorans]|jgi:hypothetical protein|uniref:Acid-shock protein n=1 Tax=Caballeronia mineralivorans PML1(12) TaxID=908627 RepID=A0A0J1FSY4_9BURK|nr:hypothetical protein [Caballeronia mineralivorans]KLU22913.1 hypothetical protein EOS_28345 [Caballeronia mineralivorans PML1(12)]MDB5781630.1 hypothetical protein [Caballeronia mineralivorans]MEA3105167.1 hypothetical protein [Caballeronia mineralivorans]
MIKLTPVLAVAAAVLFTSGSPAAFAQDTAKPGTGASSSTASSYSPPVTEHKKKPRKPRAKKGASMPASAAAQ